MADPMTALHYAPNANVVGGVYAPAADGFNLADVSSAAEADALPAGVQGLVYLGDTSGVTTSFESAVNGAIGDAKVYGFYLADEPGPDISAANLKAESDYIHSVDPGAKTFIVLENNGSPTNPSYSFNPANTDIDLFGVDPYPIRPQFTNGVDYSVIGDAVAAAEAEGIPQSALVPVYQAFGGGQYTSWTLPTASQEQTILSTWGQYLPNPAFDYAYSWGIQAGDTALVDDPALQAIFASHNAGTLPAQGTADSTANVAPTFTPPPSTSTNISSENLQLGSATAPMTFIYPGSHTVPVGSGADTLDLQVNEDTWNGDAQFTVAVDGQQIGSTLTALASHAAGDAQDFLIKGDFGAGQHIATVKFLNDAYGGSQATDRNLYVTGASYDGQSVSGSSLNLYWNGSESFAF
jgi:hypothetical protein